MVQAKVVSSTEHDYVPPKQVDDPATWALLRHWAYSDQPSGSGQDHDAAESFHPTRLLDLEPQDLAPTIVRLVEAENIDKTRPYMTLSHCWGKLTVIKLETESLRDFMNNGLLVSQLPRLYRDAIHAARKLGQRYLWIDSLCIIQDFKDDWLREAGCMALVYKSSWCNIAATDAEDSHGTLFFTRDNPAAIRPLEITLERHPKGPTKFLLYESEPEEPLSKRPLNRRGWVLQEQLLAPRTISFGKDQIRWEGLEDTASEAFPGGDPSMLSAPERVPTFQLCLPRHMLKKWIAMDGHMQFDLKSDLARSPQIHPGVNGVAASPWESFLMSWYQIIEEYTARDLTFGSDKVVAIAGIASVLIKGQGKDALGSSYYLAGLWNREETIIFDVLWNVGPRPDGQPSKRSRDYRAPSWSWMSMDGEIKFGNVVSREKQVAYVRDAKISTIDGSLTGPIVSGYITIEGPLVEASSMVLRDHDGDDVGFMLDLKCDGEEEQEEEGAMGQLAWLIMFSDKLKLYLPINGLALRRIESGPNHGCYKRVGTFTVYSRNFRNRRWRKVIDEMPTQIVKII